jgi:hypothetical protein
LGFITSRLSPLSPGLLFSIQVRQILLARLGEGSITVQERFQHEGDQVGDGFRFPIDGLVQGGIVPQGLWVIDVVLQPGEPDVSVAGRLSISMEEPSGMTILRQTNMTRDWPKATTLS